MLISETLSLSFLLIEGVVCGSIRDLTVVIVALVVVTVTVFRVTLFVVTIVGGVLGVLKLGVVITVVLLEVVVGLVTVVGVCLVSTDGAGVVIDSVLPSVWGVTVVFMGTSSAYIIRDEAESKAKFAAPSLDSVTPDVVWSSLVSAERALLSALLSLS